MMLHDREITPDQTDTLQNAVINIKFHLKKLHKSLNFTY